MSDRDAGGTHEETDLSDADADVQRPSEADSQEIPLENVGTREEPDAEPTPGAGEAGGPESGVPLAERLEAAEAAAAARHEDWLRALAEIENLRKRSARELDEQTRRTRERVLADLLTIVDDVERAIEAMERNCGGTDDLEDDAEPAAESVAGVREGVRLIHSSLLEMLARYEVRPMDCLGEPFDPHLHEAVMHEPSDEHAADHVTRVLQRGYFIGERVLRPARVAVSP